MSQQPPPRGRRQQPDRQPDRRGAPPPGQGNGAIVTMDQANEQAITELRRQAGQIAVALPGSIEIADADRFVRAVITEIRRNPKLAGPDVDQESMLVSVMYCAQLGLWPGMLGHCFFVPLRDKNRGNQKQVNLWIGYKGTEWLAYKSSRILIDAEVVRERDYFDYRKGTNPYLDFREGKGTIEDRGDPIAVWATGTTPDGRATFNVMDISEVYARRARSQAWQQQGKSSPWGTDEEAMVRKTGVKALAPLLPLSTETQEAFTRDDLVDLGLTKRLSPPEIRDETKAVITTGRLQEVAGAMAEGHSQEGARDPQDAKPVEGVWSDDQHNEFDMLLSSIPDDKRPGQAAVDAMEDSPFEGAMKALQSIAERAGKKVVNGEGQGDLGV